MISHIPTTPFGRRSLTLAHVAANAQAKACVDAKPVHKWQLFRDVCAAKCQLGVSERSLAVLDALLSFHPETVLTSEGLIVFPSNRQLSLRAHGMAEATLRRHLAALATAGLIVRRDSPNGKRYARKDRAGEIEKAFGFDLAPIVARAEEIASLAALVRDEELALRLVRERITLCRRDIVKMITLGVEEGETAEWQRHHAAFRAIIERLPRNGSRAQLEPIAGGLARLAEEIEKRLETLVNFQKMNGNPDHSERHKQNSKTKHPPESEPRLPKDEAARAEPTTGVPKRDYAFPLGMVLDACSDLNDYARDGISTWRDFLATIATVRPMLGVSPSAWEDALDAMGEANAAITVGCILQRGAAIGSAGGYLRHLARRARNREFSVGPMVMALLSVKRQEKRLSARC